MEKEYINISMFEYHTLMWMKHNKDRYVINTDGKSISPLLSNTKRFSSVLGHLSRKGLVAKEWVDYGRPCCVGYYLTDLGLDFINIEIKKYSII